MVDHHPYRLQHAQQAYGVEPINFDEVDDPAQYIVDSTGNRDVEGSLDCVGFEAKGSVVEIALSIVKAEGGSGEVIRQAIAATRRGETVSFTGLYTGFIHAFLIGDAFEKELTSNGGKHTFNTTYTYSLSKSWMVS